MQTKKKPIQTRRKKELRFHHRTNRFFKGYLLRETEDFYTILLSSDVAGLNAIWYAGEEVIWSKDLTRIVDNQQVVQKENRRLYY